MVEKTSRFIIQMITLVPCFLFAIFFTVGMLGNLIITIEKHKKFDTWVAGEAQIDDSTKSKYFNHSNPRYSATTVKIIITHKTGDAKLSYVVTGSIIIPPNYGFFKKMSDREIRSMTEELLNLHKSKIKPVPVLVNTNSNKKIAVLNVPDITGTIILSTVFIGGGLTLSIILIFCISEFIYQKFYAPNADDLKNSINHTN
ncbi:hypothetical protein OAG24_00880 [bacterium]|nr:hypothetical protein [bacterium]